MQDHVYKTVEITGSSTSSMEQAVERAMAESAPNARFVELTGTDHADFTQSTTAVKVVRQCRGQL